MSPTFAYVAELISRAERGFTFARANMSLNWLILLLFILHSLPFSSGEQMGGEG